MNKLVKAVKDLRDIKTLTFIQASALAYDTAKAAGIVQSYEDVARRLDVGTETVHRYFTDAAYNCPAKRIPEMCRVLGNTIMLDWQLAQINAHLFTVETDKGNGTLLGRMSMLRKELGDILVADSEALRDGEYSDPEKQKIALELRHLIRAGETALFAITEGARA